MPRSGRQRATTPRPTGLQANGPSHVGHINILSLLVALRIVNALTISTFFQPDEYFQSLEPAWQMAFGPDAGAWITWEWRTQLRSSVHPGLFAAVYRSASFVARLCDLKTGAAVSGLLITAPKITQAVFAALCDYFTWRLAERTYGRGNPHAWATLALTVLSPWQWFCSTRTLSNCLETTITVAAAYHWPWQILSGSRHPPKSVVDGAAADIARSRDEDAELSDRDLLGSLAALRLSLVLAAFACILRPTNILIWICIAVETVRLARTSQRLVLIREAVLCGLSVLGLSVLSDRLYYQEWTLPPFRFLYFNVVQSLAAFYGKNRTDYYLTEGLPLLLTTYTLFAGVGLYQALFGRGGNVSLPSYDRPINLHGPERQEDKKTRSVGVLPISVSGGNRCSSEDEHPAGTRFNETPPSAPKIAKEEIDNESTNQAAATAAIRRVLAITATAMTVVLSVISHKEVRFLYPVLPFLHILAAPPLVAFLFSPRTAGRGPPAPAPVSSARQHASGSGIEGNISDAIRPTTSPASQGSGARPSASHPPRGPAATPSSSAAGAGEAALGRAGIDVSPAAKGPTAAVVSQQQSPHHLSSNASFSIKRIPTAKKTIVLILLTVNVVIAYYTSIVHQRGVISVLHRLRQDHELCVQQSAGPGLRPYPAELSPSSPSLSGSGWQQRELRKQSSERSTEPESESAVDLRKQTQTRTQHDKREHVASGPGVANIRSSPSTRSPSSPSRDSESEANGVASSPAENAGEGSGGGGGGGGGGSGGSGSSGSEIRQNPTLADTRRPSSPSSSIYPVANRLHVRDNVTVILPVTTVAFFMPCHSTPWRSHLVHAGIHAWALTCEPPLGVPLEERDTYLDEADVFYADVERWLRQDMEGWLRERMRTVGFWFDVGPGDGESSDEGGKDDDDQRRRRKRAGESAVEGQESGWVEGQGLATNGYPKYFVFFEQLEPAMKKVFGEKGLWAGNGQRNLEEPYKECFREFNTHWHDDWRRQGDVVVWCREGVV